MIKLITFIMFQCVWFAAILGAGAGYIWLGPLAAVIFFIVFMVYISEHPMHDAEFAGVSILIGTVMDTLTARVGAFTYPQPTWQTFLAAPFMLALWPAFSLMMVRCIKWIRKRYILGAVFGAVGGPLSYWSGAKLGAVELHPDAFRGLGLVAAEWAVSTVFLLIAWNFIIPETLPKPGDESDSSDDAASESEQETPPEDLEKTAGGKTLFRGGRT